MPGPYTHLTMVVEASSSNELQTDPDFPVEAIDACDKWPKFCELGAVSPDYPYLDFLSERSKQWANHMHNRTTDGVIKWCIEKLRGMEGLAKEKGLAWLLGYTAHVVMDVTIHPVINEKVGPYDIKANQQPHRDCEMNQDVHIFPRLNLGSVKLAEFLDQGIGACGDGNGGLDKDIRELWIGALTDTYPKMAADGFPNVDKWHRWFKPVLDTVEELGWLSPMARHVHCDSKVPYPREDHLEWKYIHSLPTPDGGTIDFVDLFEIAKNNVHHIWKVVALAVLDNDNAYQTELQHWDLDTGRDKAGKLVFWPQAT